MFHRELARDTRGAGMVEYLLLVGVVALLAVVAFRYFNTSVRSKVQQQGDTVVQIASQCVGGLCPIKPEE